MKADEIKIFRLEDRVLFEAAAAAEVVEAAQNDPGANDAAANENKQNDNPVVNAPVEPQNVSSATPSIAPEKLADVDAQVNALIDGVTAGSNIDVTDDTAAGSTISQMLRLSAPRASVPPSMEVDSYDELNDALQYAAKEGGTHEITVTGDIDFNGYEVISVEFSANTSITITGSSDTPTITGTDGEGVFSFVNNDGLAVSITIDQLILQDAEPTDPDADGEENGIYSLDVNLTITNSTLKNFDNSAVYVENATDFSLTVDACDFMGNKTNGNGGALNVVCQDVTITDSRFSQNEAESGGGAIAIEDAKIVRIETSSFDNNSAAGNGGAVLVDMTGSGSFTITDSTFYKNTSDGFGGAVSFFKSVGASANYTAQISNSTFTGNTAMDEESGHAVYNGAGTLTIANTLLVSNGTGGDVWQEVGAGQISATNSMITAVHQNSGTISAGEQINAAYTADQVFDIETNLDDLYEAGDHTLAVNPFHEAAWQGADAADNAKDQLGNLRNSINTTLGISGMYTIGAVTAKPGVYVAQQDYETFYTGSEITPENKTVLLYADKATQVTKGSIDSVDLASDPASIKNVGEYTITPSNATITGLDVAVDYLAGTLTVNPAAGGLVITVTATKVYDGTAGMGVSTFEYVIHGANSSLFDESWITITDFTYASKNVEGLKDASGTYSLSGGASNFTISEVVYKGEITPLDLTVTANGQTIVYGQDSLLEMKDYTITGWLSGEEENDIGSMGIDNASRSGAGKLQVNETYNFTGTGLNAGGNYTIHFTSASITVTPLEIDLTVDLPTDKTYDGTDSVASSVQGNNILNGDQVQLDISWKYNSPNVAEADTITLDRYQLSGTDAGNYSFSQNFLDQYQSVNGAISAKDVQVSFDTDEPYVYNGTDQSDTVSATITDVNGNPVKLVIDWQGKSFTNVGSYSISADFAVANPNYRLIGNTRTLQMNPGDFVYADYSEGLNPNFSSTVPSVWGIMLADGRADANTFTMPWSELISTALLDARGKDGVDYPGMNYGLAARNMTVTVDPLVFLPMELDSIVREGAELLDPRETITRPQGLYQGMELFIDGSHPAMDSVSFPGQRFAPLSPDHEPVYVEQDCGFDGECMTVSAVMDPDGRDVLLPEGYDLAVLADVLTAKAENMKSDLERLLDDLCKVS